MKNFIATGALVQFLLILYRTVGVQLLEFPLNS